MFLESVSMASHSVNPPEAPDMVHSARGRSVAVPRREEVVGDFVGGDFGTVEVEAHGVEPFQTL